MRKIILAASAAFLLVPATAQAGKLETRYSALYHAAADKLGNDAVGRNIRAQGVRTDKGVREAHRSDYRASIATLDRWLHPVQVVPVAQSAAGAPQTAATAPQTGYSGGMPDCTWRPESGGSYTARNASGAGGKYQIMPGTWKANGGTGANAADAPPAEQEAVARRVMATQGPSAWVNC